jgi:hypothetical protein
VAGHIHVARWLSTSEGVPDAVAIPSGHAAPGAEPRRGVRPEGLVSELDLVILAPSGEVLYHDGLRQAGVWFLADADDAFGFVAELASDLPNGR